MRKAILDALGGITGAYQAHMGKKVPQKLEAFIRQEEARLPSLSSEHQREAADRLSAIKAAAKTEAISSNLEATGYALTKMAAGQLLGPAGSSLATYALHDRVANVQAAGRRRVVPSRKVGGQRRKPVRGEKKPRPSAIQSAAAVGLLGAGAKEPMNFAWNAVNWTWNSASSIFW